VCETRNHVSSTEEGGIRGKLWRVIDDLLTDTYARVLTTFGLTSPLRTEVGIVQGGVLFNPISTACSNLSPSINSDKLSIQLYMEDGTTIALRDIPLFYTWRIDGT
jgi:hypothetical protein